MSVSRLLTALVFCLCGVTATAAPAEFRSRLSHDASSGLDIGADVVAELRFGREIAARLLRHFPLYEDAALTRYVTLLGQSITRHGGRPELQYRFAVLDSDEVNAYAAPGGYIFVTRAAVAAAGDEAELAAVLAHEIAHVERRHIVEALHIRARDDGAHAGLALLLGGAGDSARIAFGQAVDRAVEILLSEGLQQADEFDADHGAAVLLSYAGYPATALARYLARLAPAEATTTALHRTHPPLAARMAALPEAAAATTAVTPAQHARFVEHLKALQPAP